MKLSLGPLQPYLRNRKVQIIGGSAIAVVLAGSITAIALSGGGGGSPVASPTTPTPTPTETTPTSTPTLPPAVAPKSPYTGEAPSKNGVVAVKIDDTANGRPQMNIDEADVVYIEQVEGGLTRLLAVYNTTLPKVEAVRSTRNSDPEILAQYGPIGYVASGGAPVPLLRLHNSPLKANIMDAGAPGFTRDPSRPAPYNVIADLSLIAKEVKAPTAKSIGLTFVSNTPTTAAPSSASAVSTGTSSTTGVPSVTPGGTPTSVGGTPTAPSSVSAPPTAAVPTAKPAKTIHTVVGATSVDFVWNVTIKQYVRVIDGVVQRAADGKVIATPNVVVQFCDVHVDTTDIDVVGNPSMYTKTVGSGTVVVFRGGRRYNGTWKRAKPTDGTTLTGDNGAPLALATGGEWFALAAKGSILTVG
jgi:hypothetical protein